MLLLYVFREIHIRYGEAENEYSRPALALFMKWHPGNFSAHIQ